MAQARLPGWQVSLTEISGIGWRNRAISRCGAAPFCKGLLGCLRVRSKRKKTPNHLLESRGKDIGVDTLFLSGPGATGPFLASSCTPLYPGLPGGPGSYTVRTQRSISPRPASRLRSLPPQ